MTTLKLSKPTKINGSELSEIKLDFESLKGRDLIEVEQTFRTLHRGFFPSLNFESRYQALVASRVCGINAQDLEELAAPDWVALCSEVQNFLLSSG
jgi:Phage tail assembly chaperone proteins, E, or 41 or 14